MFMHASQERHSARHTRKSEQGTALGSDRRGKTGRFEVIRGGQAESSGDIHRPGDVIELKLRDKETVEGQKYKDSRLKAKVLQVNEKMMQVEVLKTKERIWVPKEKYTLVDTQKLAERESITMRGLGKEGCKVGNTVEVEFAHQLTEEGQRYGDTPQLGIVLEVYPTRSHIQLEDGNRVWVENDHISPSRENLFAMAREILSECFDEREGSILRYMGQEVDFAIDGLPEPEITLHEPNTFERSLLISYNENYNIRVHHKGDAWNVSLQAGNQKIDNISVIHAEHNLMKVLEGMKTYIEGRVSEDGGDEIGGDTVVDTEVGDTAVDTADTEVDTAPDLDNMMAGFGSDDRDTRVDTPIETSGNLSDLESVEKLSDKIKFDYVSQKLSIDTKEYGTELNGHKASLEEKKYIISEKEYDSLEFRYSEEIYFTIVEMESSKEYTVIFKTANENEKSFSSVPADQLGNKVKMALVVIKSKFPKDIGLGASAIASPDTGNIPLAAEPLDDQNPVFTPALEDASIVSAGTIAPTAIPLASAEMLALGYTPMDKPYRVEDTLDKNQDKPALKVKDRVPKVVDAASGAAIAIEPIDPSQISLDQKQAVIEEPLPAVDITPHKPEVIDDLPTQAQEFFAKLSEVLERNPDNIPLLEKAMIVLKRMKEAFGLLGTEGKEKSGPGDLTTLLETAASMDLDHPDAVAHLESLAASLSRVAAAADEVHTESQRTQAEIDAARDAARKAADTSGIETLTPKQQKIREYNKSKSDIFPELTEDTKDEIVEKVEKASPTLKSLAKKLEEIGLPDLQVEFDFSMNTGTRWEAKRNVLVINPASEKWPMDHSASRKFDWKTNSSIQAITKKAKKIKK